MVSWKNMVDKYPPVKRRRQRDTSPEVIPVPEGWTKFQRDRQKGGENQE